MCATTSEEAQSPSSPLASSSSHHHIVVVGIGAMGGGMARALLDSNVALTVTGHDQAAALVQAFHVDAVAANKAATSHAPTTLHQAIRGATSAAAAAESAAPILCLVVLQNEAQCQQVCFGSNDNDDDNNNNNNNNLLSLLPAGSCVIVSSTVTARWMQTASPQFLTKGIYFVDCPVSGGPARARTGDLTLMAAAADQASWTVARPVLDALSSGSKDLYVIQGGAGSGSTVKMVHQLLAGVHICAAAEALALAAKAGLDVQQLYQIVQGAAGASWMFGDRGPRMMTNAEVVEIKSQLQIFVKDLDIVYSEAKRVQSPVPLASAALQQFIAGQSLGLSRHDDSQVVQVYQTLAGVKVSDQASAASSSSSSSSTKKEGTKVGEYWRLPAQEEGGATRLEEILEVGDEPRHKLVLTNDYIRALRVCIPPNDTTLAHCHAQDSLYFFLVPGGIDVINHVQGSSDGPACDCMEFGEVRYGTHLTDQPLVHKITNTSLDRTMLCIDAEVLQRPPVTAAIPLVAAHHELIKTRPKCRVYKLTLQPGESVTVSYPFFHLTIALQGGTVEKGMGGGRMHWTESSKLGDVSWKEPTMEVTKKNVGTTTFVEYIAEWC